MTKIQLAVTVEVDKEAYAAKVGIPEAEVPANIANEFVLMGDALTWQVENSKAVYTEGRWPDIVQTVLNRSQRGAGGGIPLSRGEVAMLFLDGHAGDHPELLDVRSQRYGDDNLWDGLTQEDVLEDSDTAVVWSKWEPLELWPHESV